MRQRTTQFAFEGCEWHPELLLHVLLIRVKLTFYLIKDTVATAQNGVGGWQGEMSGVQCKIMECSSDS